MDLTIESAEWALVRGSLTETFTECDLSAAYPVFSTVRHLLSGDYHAVLSSVTARELFATDASEVAIEDLDTWFRSRLSNALVEASVETKFQILSIGIACLYSFIQGAWTGPLLPFKATDLLPIAASSAQEGKSRSKFLGWLMSDYEEAYALTNEPILLLLARWILVDAAKEFKDFKTMGWWTYRCAFIQQRIIENHAITLQDIIVDSLDEVSKNLPLIDLERDIVTRFNLEFGLVHHYYTQDAKALTYFKAAQNASMLVWELTGALGKRTKFQTFDATQLIVVAESRRGATVPLESASTPITLDHNDDTLLEKLKITDKNAAPQHNLSVVDQCILLAFCLNVKNTNPIHGLTTEEMFPYVRRVLDHPNNWMVHTMGLLLRCRLEMAKSRTAERSVLQLQALVDQFTVLDSTVSERMEHIFSIMLPSKWELERELGERFVSLGVIRSAMEIFERLEMWEDVVSCHIMLEEPSKAEVIVIELLKTSPNSPKFLCLLGDIKGDIQYYMKAWEVSGNRYARSMRSLGAHYFKKENMEKCVECYQLALALNPLFENSWFVLGCAAMKIENFDIAERAFNRVTVIDPDNGEAWNNLASVYIKGKKLREAFNCLKESLKHNYDASNIWENYLFVSVDIGEFSESIRAIDRVLMIRVDKPRFKDSLVDFDILDIVMLAIINGQLDSQGRAADYLAPKMAKLLETITSKLSTPRLFLICARFEQYQQHLKLALEYYQKAHRAILHHPDLATNASIFKSLVQYTIHVADAYVELGPQEEEIRMGGGEVNMVCKDWAYQAHQAVKTVVSRTKESYEDTDEHNLLIEKLAVLKALRSG
ncbi:hypothetical protein BASA50_010982 [Batrachochytrium salamandrivorans]|uniref:TPR-like protein n=1 Tax=Batrachochytrium salamandrivorans TaxID=1357716 RepID=A0ABQ8EWZ4_9FUNG|nr:hypothetical protein BASA50_010982 [Batrachochytrium salamandrivorans]